MLLRRSVSSDREMKARLGKIIFNISIWVAVILSEPGGFEKLSGEQAGIAKPNVDPLVRLVFSHRIEFVADMRAGAGVRSDGNRSCTVVKVVMRSGQPVTFQRLLEYQFGSDVFLHAGPELLQIPAADLIGETELVVIRGI